jgi:calcineurin-like phosphoesterase family protein
MSNTWLTSDTHFGHENIIKFSGRPFDNVKEMNEALVDYWNDTVSPEDTVIHLGDVAMGHFLDSWEYVKKLNGHLHLIMGNHDRIARYYGMSEKYESKFMPLYATRFETMQYQMKYMGFDLCHLPYYGDHVGEERFADRRPTDNGRWLIHGHVHEEWLVKDKMINVGVDVWDFKPAHIDTIMDMVGAKEAIQNGITKEQYVLGNYRSNSGTPTFQLGPTTARVNSGPSGSYGS